MKHRLCNLRQADDSRGIRSIKVDTSMAAVSNRKVNFRALTLTGYSNNFNYD